MTRLQQEVARKVHSIGCASEYQNESNILNITLGDQLICRLHSDGNYTYRSDEHKSEEQAEAFLKVEDIIDKAKEYITAYENAPQFEIDGIEDYRKLAEFGGVVFGAKDMGEQHGFQFSSWFKTYGGTGATMGDYSFDYDYSKQSFAERSGLVNKDRQFTTEQLEYIHRCVAFAKDNDRKLDALIKSTTDDLKRAETAVLRMSNDKYRKAIFNAQVYCNTGAGTYEKAVDMACKDMLNAGLNCVEYKNGARHTLSDYAEMALRTANKRAYLRGEGEKRTEWGISTVVVNSRQGGCPLCAEYIGKVFIDDVYSNGKQSDGNYPLLSEAIIGGLFHPRCKDSTSTYYEGITTLQPVSREEMAEMERREQLEQKQQHAERQANRFDRRAKYSLDKDNKRVCQARADEWQSKAEILSEKMSSYRLYNGNVWQNTGTKIAVEEYTGLVKHAKSKGIKLVSFENFDGDVSLIHEMIDNAEKVIQDFPKLAQEKTCLQIHNSFRLSDEDFAETIGNKIFINNYAFRNRELLAKEYNNLVNKKWFVNGTDYNSIIYHELGHVVKNVYKLSPMKIATSVIDMGNKDVIKYVLHNLSTYSASFDNGKEIISECFSNVYSEKSNNEFALKYFKECVNILLKRGEQL